ncbi:TIGR03790 family protein [bacterium]|nr:TIGR03790 family protein [bacterium]MCP5461858.1 TIGR03790 family protein [bacterium]
MDKCRKQWLSVVFSLFIIACPATASALSPEEILVIFNGNDIDSNTLSQFYQQQRSIPEKNMCYVMCPASEVITRDVYEKQIKEKVEKHLEENGLRSTIKCFVTIYGVPLKIIESRIPELSVKNEQISREIASKKQFLNTEQQIAELSEQFKRNAQELEELKAKPTYAAVDSELTLLFQDYHLANVVQNPYAYTLNKTFVPFAMNSKMYMVTRLDAQSPYLVREMIAKSIQAETTGLTGKAYFDMRGSNAGDKGYYEMDQLIKQAAELTQQAGFETVIESTAQLFEPKACPDTAIYWGWYSLQNYVDSFTFVPGAIAVHISSTAAYSLKQDNYWCRHLINNGVSATLGPVFEPMLTAYPDPVKFLEVLFSGHTIAEAFYYAAPYLSWQMTLIADPLYTPFKKPLLPKPDKQP